MSWPTTASHTAEEHGLQARRCWRVECASHLRELMGHPTAFSHARAGVPGINLAFQRLGFSLRGRMQRSCRIGTGFEDMNLWSRELRVLH